MAMGILDYIMSTALLLIFASGAYCLYEQTKYEQEQWENANVSEKETTKKCPNCGNTHLILLYSFKLKLCTDCRTEIKWYLDSGQKPLLTK